MTFKQLRTKASTIPLQCQNSIQTQGVSSCRRPRSWIQRCNGPEQAYPREPHLRGLARAVSQGSERKTTCSRAHISWCRWAVYRCSVHNFPARCISHRGGYVRSPRRRTHDHLRVFGDLQPFPLHDLDIVQATENLMLNFELGAHRELGAFLDLEGLVLKG